MDNLNLTFFLVDGRIVTIVNTRGNLEGGFELMLPLERKQEIVKLIMKQKSIKVNDLSLLYNVTEETIRRDLEKLENENILKRTHGGAVIIETPGEDLSFFERVKEHIDDKRKLAKHVAEFVKDGDTIMLDSSTTALEVGKAIQDHRQVTILTNSLNACLELSSNSQFRIISSGGILNTKTMSFEGPAAVKGLNHYCADKVIFSCKGIDLDKGIMESSEYVAEIKQEMIRSAKQVILVVDQSKFDKTALVRMDDFSQVDVMVTNFPMDERWMNKLEEHNIQVIVIEE